jgi:hypothetical protein
MRQGWASTLVFVDHAASSALCATVFSADASAATPALDPDALQGFLDANSHVIQPVPPGLRC